MYLAGLIADESKMTRQDLPRWVHDAPAPFAGSTVPAVAAQTAHACGFSLFAIGTFDFDEVRAEFR